MKAVGGIDALKKLTKREWLWCLDSVIRELKLEQSYRQALVFQGATGAVPSPSPDAESAIAEDGKKQHVDSDWEKHLEELTKQGEGDK